MYAARMEPLAILKTKGLKGSPIKGHPRRQYSSHRPITEFATELELKAIYKVFKDIKDLLYNIPILVFLNFIVGSFIIYINSSKEFEFSIILY